MATPGPSMDTEERFIEEALQDAINLAKLSRYQDAVFSRCEGHRSQTFSDAGMEFDSRLKATEIRVEKLYGPGLKYLAEKKGPEYAKLVAYLKDADGHAQAISKVLRKNTRTETEVTVVLAVHLFQQLASKVTVSNNMEGLSAMDKKCPCECGASFKTGSTGLGAYSVWHGHPDMIVEITERNTKEKAVSVPVKIIPEINKESDHEELQEEQQDDAPPQNKLPRLDMLEAENAGITVEVIKTDEVARQMVSQTITNTFAQVNANKTLSSKFVPSISCSPLGVMVFAYNEEHDILVSTKNELSLFHLKDKDKLNLAAVLEIWLALNVHFTGCNATDFTGRLAKSRFQELLKPFNEYIEFYQKAGFELKCFPDYKALNFFKNPPYIDII